MRILFVGNAIWAASGYGEQLGLFIPRLQALGHDVALACNYGLNGAKQNVGGITVYPSDGYWGNRTMMTYAADHRADLIIILHDAWVLAPQDWPDGPPVAVWAPIDHYPIPPAVLAVLSHERIQPIAMSRFGESLMDACGLNPLYVPHGVDRTVFYPRPEIRDAVRDELSIPRDAFLVGMVAANKGNPAVPRKGFPHAFHAFSRLAKEHEDVWMYVHTQAQPPINNGLNLDVLARATSCPQDRLRFPGPASWDLGMSREVVAALYQAFDVLLMPSMGEGFGIPIIEAQACGCPVISSDHSAMTELTQAGWLVTGDPWWDELQSSFFINPSIDSVHACLADAYANQADRPALAAAAAEFAAGYDADVVTEQFWVPALEHLGKAREVAPLEKPESRQVRRAAERKRAKAAA